jgi:hypothetical protein
MRLLVRALGILALLVSGLSLVLAVASWPPGGLMFAAPYLFLMIAAFFALVGGILLFLSRRPRSSGTSEGAD